MASEKDGQPVTTGCQTPGAGAIHGPDTAVTNLQDFLQPTPIIDFDVEQVGEFARTGVGDATEPGEMAIRLYYRVRDGIRYDPFSIDMTVEGLRASTTLSTGRGWCVAKAALLAACCRHSGIPAKVGFADVRNHLSTERMRRFMQTDMFYWHGYTSIRLEDAWVKATPAFNIELCRRFGVKALDFDGRHDALYHPLDVDGRRHMEYLRYRGEFADVPVDDIVATFERRYPLYRKWKQAAQKNEF